MDFDAQMANGRLLKGIIQVPVGSPEGVILLVHGIGEHIRRYFHWADLFGEKNFAFAGLDLPGHGKSEGSQGKIENYTQVYELIDILIKVAADKFPGMPVYLYGHSMGGGIVLDYTLRFSPRVKGVIATSPWLKLSFEPPAAKMVFAQALKAVMPGLVQSSGLNTVYLSHDRSVVEGYEKDPLVHGKISVAYFAGATSSARYALHHASELKIPLLLLHGSDDMICSPEGSREFASKTNLAELRIWDGGYHELHNEPFKQEVFNYIIDWISRQK